MNRSVYLQQCREMDCCFKCNEHSSANKWRSNETSNSIGENSMAWIDGKVAYNRLLSTKHCEIRVMKDHTTYTSLDHLNNVNVFHRLIEK